MEEHFPIQGIKGWTGSVLALMVKENPRLAERVFPSLYCAGSDRMTEPNIDKLRECLKGLEQGGKDQTYDCMVRAMVLNRQYEMIGGDTIVGYYKKHPDRLQVLSDAVMGDLCFVVKETSGSYRKSDVSNMARCANLRALAYCVNSLGLPLKDAQLCESDAFHLLDCGVAKEKLTGKVVGSDGNLKTLFEVETVKKVELGGFNMDDFAKAVAQVMLANKTS